MDIDLVDMIFYLGWLLDIIVSVAVLRDTPYLLSGLLGNIGIILNWWLWRINENIKEKNRHG